MKSHPDAASRSAAEVVTQLPVPSRLGLLRFERLNEPSWALLFLDPACERQLGLPATTLCALLDAPYASLMEPEARHRLHEQIQQQLVKRPHYQVSYKLHTPNGVLTMLEFGEAFQQHGRQLLHGYLMVEERAESAERSEQLLDLESQNLRLKASLDLYQRSQDDHLQHLLRSRTQQNLIVRLARHRYLSSDPLLEAAQLITQAACEAYGTARAGIWRLLDDQRLEAVTVYRRDLDQYEKPQSIDASRYPAYLEAVHSGRAIDAHNAQRDPRTQELYKDYLKPLGVNALLDATIRIGGEVVGVLCLEHAGENRMWQSDEIAFAGELADQYAQVLMNHERRNVSSALHLFQRAVEQSASAFLLIDRDGVVEYVNPSFTSITQYSADEVCNRRLSELPALENLSELLFDARSALTQQNSWQGEFRSRRKNHEPYWGQLSLSKVYDDLGELTHYIGIYEDITQNKLAQQHIEKLAYRDNLTGLANRHYFIGALEERLESSGDRPLSLLLVDIDNFKRINDSLGHQTGDKLLVSLARRLRSCLGDGATLARFASNEFAVLLDDTAVEKGESIAAQVLHMLDKPLFVDNQLINITGSIGLASAPQHGCDPQTLMKYAGLALHKAKANGKHQVQVFTEALTAEASYKLFVERQPAPRPGAERTGGALPAQAVPAQRPVARPGSPAALAASGKRHDPPGPLHQRGRGNRADRTDRQVGDPRSLSPGPRAGRGRAGRAADRHQPVAQAVHRPGPGRLDRGDPPRREHSGQPTGTGAHRKPAAGRHRRYPPATRTPEEPRPDPGDGRLRHRLLVAELPEEIPHRRDQDRPQLHQGHSGQPGRHGNHLGGDRHGPQPQAQGSRRRRGERRATGLPPAQPLRHRPGLPVRPADPQRPAQYQPAALSLPHPALIAQASPAGAERLYSLCSSASHSPTP